MAVKASREMMFDASPEVILAVLLDADSWPRWHDGISGIKRDPGREGSSLVKGEKFRFKAGPGWVSSEVLGVPDESSIAWSGSIMGIRAVHVWHLTPEDGGTAVVTEESWSGAAPKLLAGPLRKRLTKELETFLAGLRTEAEART